MTIPRYPSSRSTKVTLLPEPVNFIIWPWSVTFAADHPRLQEGDARWAWLTENFGPFDGVRWTFSLGNWDTSQGYVSIHYYFKLQADHARFTLTWL